MAGGLEMLKFELGGTPAPLCPRGWKSEVGAERARLALGLAAPVSGRVRKNK